MRGREGAVPYNIPCDIHALLMTGASLLLLFISHFSCFLSILRQGDALAKAEAALEAALAKAKDLDVEYGLLDQTKTLLAKSGDLSVEAIDKALKWADENDVAGQLSSKAQELADKVQGTPCANHTQHPSVRVLDN